MDRRAADRTAFPLLVLLLLVAFACGGGGARYGLANLAVQLAALGVLAFSHDGMRRFWRDSPLSLRILILASLALPAVQMIPLPESIWTTLPGRMPLLRSHEAAGATGVWMPLSVDPLRTLLALSALITPLAVLFAGWSLPRERLIDLGWLVVGMGLVTVLLGAAQLSSGSEAATPYGSRDPGNILLGTFANRNSTALFLTFALGLAALLPAPRPHVAVLPIRLGACALLLLAIVLTQSRTGLVLALLPIAIGLARGVGAAMNRRAGTSVKGAGIIALGALAFFAVAGGLLLSAPSERISATIERFEAKDDPRRYIWEDATFIAGKYWPAGAGMGVFDEVYQVDESLENLTLRRPGRAHNDYIELTIEAGAPGLLLAALWAVLIGWLMWRAFKGPQRWAACAAGAFLLAIALQSITDYPLRNQTILAFAGYALLLLTRFSGVRGRAQP